MSITSSHDSTITAYKLTTANLLKILLRAAHYKSPLREISALRSALPDEALSVVRYTIEPQIPDGN